MDYREAANFLFDLRRFRMKPGTAATERLLAHLGDPHVGPAYVQVAGSNGKGSTASMVASVLRGAGYDVGLYTSPHVDDVRERVRVNDRPIQRSGVREFVDAIRDYVTERAADGEAPTFFEVLTAMALWYFGREGVDVAVIEVGIGGKHDATSVVDPVASAVTNVSLEHTAVLGDTVEEIARDKAHVAPDGAPLVTAAEGAALDAIREVANDVLVVGEGVENGTVEQDVEVDAPDVAVEYGGVIDERESAVRIDGPDWSVDARLGLLGAHQARNAGVAAALARQVASAVASGEGDGRRSGAGAAPGDLDEDVLARGLRKARWPGRFEVVSREPLVVLDGAHNPGACASVAGTLDEFEYEELHLVFGAMHDKDHAGMADALPSSNSVVTCQPDLDRAEDRTVLSRVFERRGSTVETRRAVETALDRALERADSDDCVLVTGSLYTVREARRRWTRTPVPKRVRDLDDARELLESADVTPAGVWRMRGKGVHRVLELQLQTRQARYVKEEMLSLGGECALSGVQRDEELTTAVVMGTLSQFKRLAEKLQGQPYALPLVADDVRETLGIQTDPVRHGYPWEDRTVVMGILNVTPDSFHDGGRYESHDAAVERAEEMVATGADVVDVGGEATNPDVDPIPAEEERERVVPVIERIADLDALISIDTRKASVARAAVDAGANVVNDVSGLEDPEMAYVAADADVPLVVMHSVDAPVDRSVRVDYDDVVDDVLAVLAERVLRAEEAGLDRSKVIVDPGLGFGKSAAESFELLGRIGEFRALGCPVLVGHSHKSMFGTIDRYPDEGGHATAAATAIAADRGADIVRVHDVAENVAAVRAVEAANRGTGE